MRESEGKGWVRVGGSEEWSFNEFDCTIDEEKMLIITYISSVNLILIKFNRLRLPKMP